MNVPVEAQSLSALTNLFANPPQYPRNPTHEVREPLVLYIVRVPGSKDVFLTPLKPPTKASISLEAIQSCLYYLHVASDEDEEVKRIIDEQRHSEEVERTNPPIHRKPLPSTPHTNYPPSARPVPPPKSYPSYQPGLDEDLHASQGARYAARGVHVNFERDRDAYERGGRDRPQSPRKFQQPPTSDNTQRYSTSSFESSLYGSESVHSQNHTIPYSMERSISTPLQPSYLGVGVNSSTSSLNDREFHDIRLNQLQNRSPRITLIRRDPVSGSQWNVGSISIEEPDDTDAALDPVTIAITTPGYGRFASALDFTRPGMEYSDADSIKDALARGSLDVDGTGESMGSRHTFTRRAEYQKHPINARPFKLHRRADSSDSFTKPPSPTKQMRQIYSFTSPWQGICSFSNGIDGKSVRCRHTLSSSTSSGEENTVTVADLRFNLPWSLLSSTNDRVVEDENLPISQLIGPRPGKETIKRGIQQLKDFRRDLSKELRERRSSSPDKKPVLQSLPPQSPPESDLDRISLRLGREKAGGGFKGTSAKLGKLIIEDEGLKMCDLIVAACMGVWWQHYDES